MKFKQCLLILTVLTLLNFFITTIYTPYSQLQDLAEEALENGAKDPRFAVVYRIRTRLPNDTKYILLWTTQEYEPFRSYSARQVTFLNHGCSHINCYVTTDRSLFGDNVEKFDAIAFNGRNLHELKGDIPKHRLPNQLYIYFNQESPGNYPVLTNQFDNFFNWTATYRLDSDIVLPYYHIKNSKGDIIGPKVNMKWTEQETYPDKDFENILHNKTKAAAWFVSNCYTVSKREKYIAKLAAELKVYNLSVDIYGQCNKKLKCSINENEACNEKVEREYYFYLAFENSIDVDYVTEKILIGLQHKTIPIVYGGGDYLRFAPPGSYINAGTHTPKALAKIMANLISSPEQYKQYFKWYKSYTFDSSESYNVCKVCEALHNKAMVRTKSVYSVFGKWWNNPRTVKTICSKSWLNYTSFWQHWQCIHQRYIDSSF